MVATDDERLAAVEAAVAEIRQALADGQDAIRAEIKAEGEAQRLAVAAEGARVTGLLATQTEQMLGLSQALNAVSSSISRWGAAACLLGAVILFIAVRALGF